MVRMALVLRSLNSPATFQAQEWELLPDEISVMQEALRFFADAQPHWKPGHRVSAAGKLAVLSANATTIRAEPRLHALRDVYDR